jgi:hypothetical protein
MKSCGNTTIGDLVAAAFHEAAYYSADLRRVSHLATLALTRLLRRARRLSPAIGGTTFGQPVRTRAPECDSSVPIGTLIRVAVYTASSHSSYAGRAERWMPKSRGTR